MRSPMPYENPGENTDKVDYGFKHKDVHNVSKEL